MKYTATRAKKWEGEGRRDESWPKTPFHEHSQVDLSDPGYFVPDEAKSHESAALDSFDFKSVNSLN